MFSKKREDELAFYQDKGTKVEQRPNFFIRWTWRFFLIGIGICIGAAGGYLAANHWPLPSDQHTVLDVLSVMNQKLDLIWRQTSAGVQTSQSESSVTELPAIQLNGGSIKLRFKQIEGAYHYECSIEGGIDAISRLIAPNGKRVLLKATFADKDNFDLTDLTISGQDFITKEQGEGGGKDVALSDQGVWEDKVDPAKIKSWRVEVMDRDSTENKVGAAASPTPSAQVRSLAADITVHPITGRLLLPDSLQDIENKLAQATPTPSPQASPTVFQDPPDALPTPVHSPDTGEPKVKVGEPNMITPKTTPIQGKRSS